MENKFNKEHEQPRKKFQSNLLMSPDTLIKLDNVLKLRNLFLQQPLGIITTLPFIISGIHLLVLYILTEPRVYGIMTLILW